MERNLASWNGASASEQRQIAETWLAKFNEALRERDYTRVSSMMHADGYWRDLLTFGSELSNLHGIDDIRAWPAEAFDLNAADNFIWKANPPSALWRTRQDLPQFSPLIPALPMAEVMHGWFEFRISGCYEGFTILTAVKELKRYPQPTARNRSRDDLRMTSRELENWSDRRQSTQLWMKTLGT